MEKRGERKHKNDKRKRRTARQIKKEILKLLRIEDMSFYELQNKIGTDYDTIKRQISELKDVGIVVTKRYKSFRRNNLPSMVAKLKKLK